MVGHWYFRLLVMVPSTTYSNTSHHYYYLHLLMRKLRIWSNRLGLTTCKQCIQDTNLGLSASRVCFFFSALSSLPGKGPREAKVLRSTDLLRVGTQVCLAGKARFLWWSVLPPGESGRKADHLQLPGRLIPHVQASAVQGKARTLWRTPQLTNIARSGQLAEGHSHPKDHW